MEERDEDVGGLVEQYKTKKGLPGCIHAKGDNDANMRSSWRKLKIC
jgi:hypothetical protein